MLKIGTFADWFGVGLLDGIRESRLCGAKGVQVYAWKELDPRRAEKSYVAKVRQVAKDNGQEVAALCGELGGHGLERAGENPAKVDYLKKVVDLGQELGCNVVSTHIGVIPQDTSGDQYRAMLEACGEAGEYAARRGAKIAIETGPEPVARLRRFVDEAGAGVAINYDPANLVMVTRDDEVQGVYTAKGAIAHTHAKDGLAYSYKDPKEVYNIFAVGGIELMSTLSECFEETPLGEGAVRWRPYLEALADVGYDGYLTIEREVQKGAAADIRAAVDFLEKHIAALG